LISYPPALTEETVANFERVRDALRDGWGSAETLRWEEGDFPKKYWGCAVTLYQPGRQRLMVVRVQAEPGWQNVRQAIEAARRHERCEQFELADRERCRMQIDFIVEPPQPVELGCLSDAVLPDGFARPALAEPPGGADSPAASADRSVDAGHDAPDGPIFVGQTQPTQPDLPDLAHVMDPRHVQVVSTFRQPDLTRFEVGVDGLRITSHDQRRYFLPGDAFVWSVLGLNQLRRHIQRLFPGEDIEGLAYSRFRSWSYVTTVSGWTPLYRGYPVLDIGQAWNLASTSWAEQMEPAGGHGESVVEEQAGKPAPGVSVASQGEA